MKSHNILAAILVLILLITGCESPITTTPAIDEPNVTTQNPIEPAVEKQILKDNPDKDMTLVYRGEKQDIPNDIRAKMRGISMPDGATVTFDDLSYLTVKHYDFNDNIALGHLVVNKSIADEVLDIFEELAKIKYPIQTVELIDEYNSKQTKTLNSLDRASMGNNNTSCFCYRVVNGTSSISQHAYGRAIDLNPKINPYVYSGGVSPANAEKYMDRSGKNLSDVEKRALIHKNDEVYNIFISRGWEWGGEIWKGIYDYQHFQKPKK